MTLIECEDLKIGYENGVVAENISFSIGEGDYLAVIGENGSGKSTLMRTILGLQKPLGGKMIRGESLKKNEIGYLPQQTVVQKDFPASCFEVVLSGCLSKSGLRPFYNRTEKEAARKNLARTGMSGFEKRSYRALSGGQQQRILLSRTLCATDKIVFLDEPVSGLDPTATEEMYEIMQKLNEEGTAIVMISHDVEAVLKYATHVLHMGKEVFYGTKEEYFALRK